MDPSLIHKIRQKKLLTVAIIICMERPHFAVFAGIILAAVLGGGGYWLAARSVTAPTEPLLQSKGTSDDAAGAPRGAGHAPEDAVPGSDAAGPREAEVPILVYHTVRPWRADDGPSARQYNVTPETFEAQLALLKERGYESIAFDELEAALLRGGTLPEKPVLITLDDGTASHYDHAFPLLKKYGFTATFFVFTNAIDRPNYLTSAQILEMREAGMRFGNHTRYHQYLTRLPEAEASEEMRTGKERLETLLGEEVAVIAWPFGLYDEAVIAEAERLGHRLGRTIKEGRRQAPDARMELRAWQMSDSLRRLETALGE